jgi:hypothetical protein
MNVKKYPEADPHFYDKVRGACKNDLERGLIIILQWTGMHLSCLLSLTPEQMDKRGNIHWRRPKTGRPMKAAIPTGDQDLVRAWIDEHGSNRKKMRMTQYRIGWIGERAGFEDLSAMTFRVMKGCTLLDEGMPPHQVCHRLGCSLDTLMDHYAQLMDDRRTGRW